MSPARFSGRGLYVITDGPRPDLLAVTRQALEGGAQLLQYRDKTRDPVRQHEEALALKALCAEFGVPMIVNDDVALAHAVGADGVHLGEDDGDIAAARDVSGGRRDTGAPSGDRRSIGGCPAGDVRIDARGDGGGA